MTSGITDSLSPCQNTAHSQLLFVAPGSSQQLSIGGQLVQHDFKIKFQI